MIPLRLKLYKAKGILQGIKQEVIEIDFTKFSPGLVVIYGNSGTGKSTIQQNMHPYRSVGEFTFKDEFEPDGYREFEFEYGNHKYLSIVYEAKATLHKDGVFINRNKKDNRTDYDFAVEQEFGDYSTFLKLAYGGRSFANLVQLGNADMKALFVDYLLCHLAKYGEYEKKLKLQYEDVTKELTIVSAKISVIQGLENKRESIKATIDQNYTDSVETKETLFHKLEYKTKYEAQEENNKKFREQQNELMTQRIGLVHQLDTAKRDLKNNTEEYERIKAEWIKLDALKLPEVEVVDIEKINAQIDENHSILKELEDKQRNIENNNHRNKERKRLIEQQLRNLQTQLPCSGELQLQCPLTGNQNYVELKEALNRELIGAGVEVEDYELLLDIKRCKDEELRLNTISRNYNEYLKIKSQLDRKTEVGNKGKEYRDIILPPLATLVTSLTLGVEKATENIANIENLIDDTLKNPTEDIQKLEIKISAFDTSIKLYKEQLVSLEAEITSFKELEVKEKKLQSEINEYPLLLDFFGKNGGMVFEIEKAGEEVSRVANDLLKTYHNKNIQVKFETLRPSADGKKLLEVFDVMFSCDGSEWKYRLSEGEMIIASTALREAMNYLKQDKTLKSLMVDELDGSLDVGARVDYLKLLEEGHELNGRKYTFLISHMKEIQDRMMQQIHLHENSITLKY